MSENCKILKNTPLYSKHIEAGARMVPFSGWNMPVQYTGIIEEHIHTREKAGLFDICHMGEFIIEGTSATEELGRLLTCRIDDMPDGKCRYGFMLNDSGGVIDDLIVFKMSLNKYMLVVNAGTLQKDAVWIESNMTSPEMFYDESDGTAKLDIQGPVSGKIIEELTRSDSVRQLKRYCFIYIEIDGVRVLLSRTGYTGELGYELYFPAGNAEHIWDKIIKLDDIKPVGLGARDTLRLEVGYSLYGHELDEYHTPFEANLGRFVYMEKDFRGKEALLRKQQDGIDKVVVAFICEGRRSARAGFDVIVDGIPAGEVTSGAFSPCLEKGIGLGYIKKDLIREGKEIILSDGKVEIKAFIKNIPVYQK